MAAKNSFTRFHDENVDHTVEIELGNISDDRDDDETRPSSYDDEEDIAVERVDEEPKEWEPVLKDGCGMYFRRSLRAVFLGSKMNVLLIAIPFAFISNYLEWGPIPTFVLSMVGLCPLAERISFVTEELAKYTNDTIGGLLNASMGNVPEVIMTIFALRQGLLRVVQASLIGSILSNLLLVLGTAFVFGGTKVKTQKYNQSAAATNSSLLLLLAMAILMPATLSATHVEAHGIHSILTLSRFTSIVLLLVYGGLIFYQLKTHTHLFEGAEEDDDDPPILGFWGAMVWCAVMTILIAFLSEFTMAVIEEAAVGMGISILFIGTILLPIVGNAAEHAAAVLFAYRDKMEISLGIAVGSAAQIALFVIPLSVVIAWPMGEHLSLDFHVFETATTVISVIIVSFAIHTGNSDWLKGLVLLVAYLIIAAALWVHEDPKVLTL